MRQYVCFALMALMLVACVGASASSLISQGLDAGAYTSICPWPANQAPLAFDGNFDTMFVAAGAWDFVQVDLGQTMLLDHVELYTAQDQLDRAVMIYISDSPMIVNGGLVLSDPVYNAGQVTAAIPSCTLNYAFATDTTARYVAVNAANTNNVDWLVWNEIQVYGGPIVPEPSGIVVLMVGASGVIGYLRRKK
jgi:hypothetical protein